MKTGVVKVQGVNVGWVEKSDGVTTSPWANPGPLFIKPLLGAPK